MSNQNQLSEFAKKNLQKVVKGDLHAFMQLHPRTLVQLKHNGTRVLAISNGETCRMASKHNGIYYPETYPNLFRDLVPKMGKNTVLDGELLKNPDVRDDAQLMVFDVLFDRGEDVRPWDLFRRQLLLEGMIRPEGNVRMVESKFCDSELMVLEYFDFVVRMGAEGIVVKDLYASYNTPGSWLKLRAVETIDAVVIGKDPPDANGVEWTYTVGLFGSETEIHYGHYITDQKAKKLDNEPEPKWGWTARVSSATSNIDRKKIEHGTVLEVRFNKFRGEIQFPGTIVRIRDDKAPAECTVDQLEGLQPSSGSTL